MSDFLVPLPLILLGWAIGGGSPGPATLAISSTSMEYGRRNGLLLALGVVVGSATWGIAAALGFSAVMVANAWAFTMLRYVGASYLLYLAFKSLRSAWQGQSSVQTSAAPKSGFFVKGLLLHLTNPKAILGWGSIYSVALTAQASPLIVAKLFVALIVTSNIVFLGYAVLFSTPSIVRGYVRMRRGFELAFGLLFGAASLKLLTVKLTP